MDSARTDHDDFARLLAQSRKAAGEWLVSRYADDVFGLCHSIVRQRATAEDLTQEVFSRALAGISQYRGEAAPRTWLLTIARHRCIDHLRLLRRERSLFIDDEGDGYADEVPLVIDRITSSETARRALDALDEADRSVVVLRFGHGLEYEEIADVFGVRPGTVRMRVSRALGRMRDALGVVPPLAPSAAPAAFGAAPPRATPPAPARSPAPAPAAAAPPAGLFARARAVFGGGKAPAPERASVTSAAPASNAHLQDVASAGLRERLLSLVQ